MYEYTDKVIKYMRRKFIRLFEEFKGVMYSDEINIIQESKSLYEKLEKITEENLLSIAQHEYEDIGDSITDTITMMWLFGLLNDYDPVTKYVYIHEVDRKRARFAESVIASTNKAGEVKTALRYWSNMVTQYAITVTDKARLQAYKDIGVKKVKWITTQDERTCSVCKKRDGKTYKIDSVPPKPHLNCRCYVIPYKKGVSR